MSLLVWNHLTHEQARPLPHSTRVNPRSAIVPPNSSVRVLSTEEQINVMSRSSDENDIAHARLVIDHQCRLQSFLDEDISTEMTTEDSSFRRLLAASSVEPTLLSPASQTSPQRAHD